MYIRREVGNAGEEEIVERVKCPNCAKALMRLPTNYPMYDVQCTGCNFRAQVKTISSKPRSEILGAGWDIMDKVLKAGYLAPQLIVNFKWTEKEISHQEIRFYPFVPKKNLKMYRLSEKHPRPGYKMFRYSGINDLPYFVLDNR